MNKPLLLVGGPIDGQVWSIPESSQSWLAVNPSYARAFLSHGAYDPICESRYVYYKFSLCGQLLMLGEDIYRPPSQESPTELLVKRLLARYRGGEEL